jgi:hypothetical protein
LERKLLEAGDLIMKVAQGKSEAAGNRNAIR